MIPTKAYELARSAGWSPIVLVGNDSMIPQDAPWQIHALDPKFFQSLGKALGWKDDYHTSGWRRNARTLYDLILTGSDTQAFWDELLTPIEE